jgi:hypothetical protein
MVLEVNFTGETTALFRATIIYNLGVYVVFLYKVFSLTYSSNLSTIPG